MNLQRAIEIAVEAHRDQVDKAGAPYILHSLRVMMSVEAEEERIVAVLHDVVEDGPGWTFEQLEGEEFPASVIAALRLVTKRPEDQGDDEESYLRFVSRTLPNAMARRVKIADIRDNLNAARMNELTESDRLRMNRYIAALKVLGA